MSGLEPASEEGNTEFKKKVKGANGAEDKTGLVEVQNQIEGGANFISYSTEALRQKAKTKKSGRIYKTR